MNTNPIFKLATNNGKYVGQSAPRPIQTHYNGGQVSFSRSPIKAANAAMRRVVAGDYKVAQIYKGQVLVAVVSKRYNVVTLRVLNTRLFN